MNIYSLVWSEIIHRKLNFVIALTATTVAVASCVAISTMWDIYRVRTASKVAALDDEIRKITKDMGFNITILPKDQNLADFHASDFADKTMPLEFVQRLAESPDIVTINHLRPALIRKVNWPERNREILLMGVSGVVPFAHRDPKKPLELPVPAGTMNVGHQLARELGLREGDTVPFMDRGFKVGKVFDERGTKDDVTVWIDLEAAQELLQMPGQINMIQALECNCGSIDRLADIQREISGLLGNEVQIIELKTKAIARAKAREGVRLAGEATVARLTRLAKRLLPLLTIAAGVIVGLLSLSNVRERRGEIGVLRTIGLRSRQILALFLTKAALLGFLGGLCGYLIGLSVGGVWGGESATDEAVDVVLFQPGLLAAAILITPLLVIAASWLPAVIAATQDPAVVLREE